jgi:hypothetical protein
VESQEQVTQSIPRLVNVRATPKGAACPEFVAWLFDRMVTPPYLGVPSSSAWITQRFMRIS